MAELYGRLSRLPHRGLTSRVAWLCAALVGVATSSASAQTHAPAPSRPAVATVAANESESDLALDAQLAQLRVDSIAQRRAAIAQLMNADASDVPAIRTRLLAPLPVNSIAVHGAMVRAVHAATGGRPNAPYDLLDALVQLTPRSPDVVIATERVALARALGRIPSSDAGRAMFAFALEHQHIFRLECLRIIQNTLKDYILPALIESRRPSDDARMLIRQIREMLHRVTPGDTVQTRDNALLAEILRAYGAMHENDALNVVVSFVNSDRTQVRDAARWAVAQFGRDAINALRQAYENYVGQDADPQWGWERVARELYQANDHRRADEVSHALDEGLAAARQGRYDDMMARFEFVLSHHPLYERRAEMVPPLVSYAHSLEGTNALRAEQIYRLAVRVDPSGPVAHVAQGAVLYLEAERALGAGVADPELYRAALHVDPANQRAATQLEAVAQVEVLRARKRRRVLIAIGLFTVALAGLGILLSRLRRAPVPTTEPLRAA